MGAPSVCTTTCGDGIPAGTEECDELNSIETDGCTTDCKVGVLCDVIEFPGGDSFAVDPATGHCYVSYDDDQTTFAAAETACEAVGGHLATITGAAEQTVVAFVQNAAQNPWIGATDELVEGSFGWITGEAFSFTAWGASQPDGGDPEDCVNMSAGTGLWNDTSCTFIGFTAGHICEIEVLACGDGVTQGTEVCDDGNQTNGDGCDRNCTVTACGNGIVTAGEECDDNNTTDGDGCSSTCTVETLLFSEYLEGSGTSNKAVEIKNKYATSFDLAANSCSVNLYQNGSATVSQTVSLAGTIAAGDVFVLCRSDAGAAILAVCDQQHNATMNFNGDDAVELICNGTTLDVIGQIGFDPGTQWGSGGTTTLDHTLQRKCSVTTGDTNGADAFDPATEWGGFAIDTITDLGLPGCSP